MTRTVWACVVWSVVLAVPAFADQPIFSEMPRWDNGWGVQVVDEYRVEKDLLLGRQVVGAGFKEEVHLVHVEGVYTWDKSIRMTAKLPYVVSARRELQDGMGGKRVQRDRGFGDLTLAMPLKHYFNEDHISGSYTLAPQVRVPLGSKSEYDVYDHEWGGGLSIGYEQESHQYIVSTGLSGWAYEGSKNASASASLDVGLNFILGDVSGHVKWESDLLYEDDDSLTYAGGPSFYLRITDVVHMKVSWKRDWYDRQGTLDHGNGDQIRLGFAVVF